MIRRAIGTTLASLCALTGPLAGGAFATTDPGLTLSASSAGPGAAFTVTPAGAVGCPAASGVQAVDLTFTDSAGVRNSIGSIETDEDGIWGTTTVQLPVAGLDGNNEWSDQPVAPGAGTVSAACFVRDGSGDDAGDDDSDGDDGDDPDVDGASVASLDDGDAAEVATL